VWRESNCESHFIVRRGSVWIVERSSWFDEDSAVDRSLVDAVSEVLGFEFTHFSRIADQLEKEPWDVLDALRTLQRSGLAQEGGGERLGSFRRPGRGARSRS
jgi:hypothetical protein